MNLITFLFLLHIFSRAKWWLRLVVVALMATLGSSYASVHKGKGKGRSGVAVDTAHYGATPFHYDPQSGPATQEHVYVYSPWRRD